MRASCSKTLTGTAEIPNTNVPALRLALGSPCDGYSPCPRRQHRRDHPNGRRQTGGAIRRLQDQAGPGTPVLVHDLDRDEACRRVRQIVKSGRSAGGM